MKMTYDEWRVKHQNEVNALPIFFAFSNEQFEEELGKRGLTMENLDQVRKVAGGFCLAKDVPVIRAFLDKPDELPELMKDSEFAEGAFYSEMCNHEFGINWQGAWDVCRCFGDPEYCEGKSGAEYLDEMGYGAETIEAWGRAKSRYYKAAEDGEWF